MRKHVLALACVATAIFGSRAAQAAAAPPTPGLAAFNRLTLSIDNTLSTQNRPDLVLLYDWLAQQQAKNPAQFAQGQAALRATISDYENVVTAATKDGPTALVARATAYLATKGYQPDPQLSLSVYTMADPSMDDILHRLQLLQSNGKELRDQVPTSLFTTEIATINHISDIAKSDANLRSLVESSLSNISGTPFNFSNPVIPGISPDLDNTLNQIAQGQLGTITYNFAEDYANKTLQRAHDVTDTALKQATKIENDVFNALKQLKAANPGKDLEDLFNELPDTLFHPPTAEEIRAQLSRSFEVRNGLNLASQLAALGGNRDLANKLGAASDFYTRTNLLIKALRGFDGSTAKFDDKLAMASSMTNWVGMAFNIASMVGSSNSGPSESELILKDLADIKMMLADLAKTLDQRFNALDYSVAVGFQETLDALKIVDFKQQQTLTWLYELSMGISDIQKQITDSTDSNMANLLEAGFRASEDAASVAKMSDSTRDSYGNLLRLITSYSTDRLSSPPYSDKTGPSDMATRFSGLLAARSTTDLLSEPNYFAFGTFLKGYFTARYSRTLAVGPVPNLQVMLRGLGLEKQMRAKFPELQSELTPERKKDVLDAFDTLENFWNSMAMGTDRKYTFAGSLYEASLNKIEANLLTMYSKVLDQEQAFTVAKKIDIFADNPIPDTIAKLRDGPAITGTGTQKVQLPVSVPGGQSPLNTLLDAFTNQLPDRLPWPPDDKALGRFFTQAEIVDHLLNLNPDSKLSVKLGRYGLTNINATTGEASWTITLNFFRGDKLLRSAVLVRQNVPVAAPPISGQPTSLTGVLAPFIPKPAAPMALDMWSKAMEDLASPATRYGLMSDGGPPIHSTSNFLITIYPEPESGGADFLPPNVNQTTRAKAESYDQKIVALAKDDFEKAISEFNTNLNANGGPDFKAAKASYEENRLALKVLLCFGAPKLFQNPSLRTTIDDTLVPADKLLDLNFFEAAKAIPKDAKQLPKIQRLVRVFKARYEATTFPQTPEFLTLARTMFETDTQ